MLSPFTQVPPPQLSSPLAANGFTITDGGGYIRVTGAGCWTPAEVDRHFDALIDKVRQNRLIDGHARVLVDLRKSGAQSDEANARLGARVRLAYMPGDRVAIILDSSLAKMQMRRVVRTAQHAFFLSPDAAVTWLMAYETAPQQHATA